MAGGKAVLKQCDLTRYVKAVRGAGIDALRVEIEPNGKVVIFTGIGEMQASAPYSDTTNPCDRLLD
jgi:hypothetical protein